MSRLLELLATLSARNRSLTALGWMHVALAAVCLAALSIDEVQLLGVSRWLKPAKFGLSIGIYLLTMAWLFPVVPSGRVQRTLAALIGGTMLVEIVAIVLQALRSTTSHFNITSAFNAAVFASMGVAIGINTVANVVVGIYAYRAWRRDPSPYLLAVVLGVVVFLVGSGVGGIMVSQQAHTVGAPDGSPGLPFVNWSREHGDWRAAHFLGMHALQIVPLVGWIAGARGAIASASAILALTVFALARAFAGAPVM